ncbi:MAG: ZIP family metal transporter [Burkholderiaceae bacterium]|nr:ZIP family metal transporter [Burkholderiaceae bacterium]
MSFLASLSDSSPFMLAVLASLTGGFLATALGALPVLVMRDLSLRANNAMLAFAAGVMLAATVFSLLLPGFVLAQPMLGGRLPAAIGVVLAMAAGGLLMALIHRFIPHEHFEKGPEGPGRERLSRVWLFVLAITVHNFPEGLSIGVGAASGDLAIGLGVTLGIGMQNIPEGLAVAMALAGLGYGRLQAFGVAALTGAVELVGGLAGAGLLEISQAMLPAALAFAAGTMLFVISDEVIPETHRAGFGDTATAALFVGFGLMFVLDVALG